MTKKQKIDLDNFELNISCSLNYMTEDIINNLKNKYNKYLEIFDIESFRKIIINFFDNNEEFRKFIYNLRGEKDSLPEYATGTFDNGMINAYINPSIIEGTRLYNNKLFLACHELFHIMYKELILKDDYSKRIVWYDEGMALFLSGEKDYLLDKNNFRAFYNDIKKTTKNIENLNEIEHGNSFVNDYYNGYDLSYLAVRYLYETLKDNEFRKLMNNYDLIKEYGNTIINDMFNYYDNK